MSSEEMMSPVNPYRCERCGEQDHLVRLFENGRPDRLGPDWRLMPLHPACFGQWQDEHDLRRGSRVEVDYGHHWTLPTGQRARLSWNVATGVLYLCHPDRNVGGSALLVESNRERIEDLLTGWDDTSQGSLHWLGQRLWLVGATLPPWAAPLSRRD